MPLTPEDVHNKRFTPVRLREGYDMGEVDAFLDEVEAELQRLHTELGGADADPAAGKQPEHQSGSDGSPAAATGIAEASGAAARLLEIATRNAEQLVEEAKDQAERMRTEAKTKADRLQSEARTKAERVEAEARSRSEQLAQETSERRTQLFDQLERERDQLAKEVEELRAFEREYRSRLRAYFETQLEALQDSGTDGRRVPAEAPPRQPSPLEALLGEDR